MRKIIIIYLVIAYFSSIWPFSEERWEGFVYPNKNDLSIHKNIGTFDSIDDCRTAGVQECRSAGVQECSQQ